MGELLAPEAAAGVAPSFDVDWSDVDLTEPIPEDGGSEIAGSPNMVAVPLPAPAPTQLEGPAREGGAGDDAPTRETAPLPEPAGQGTELVSGTVAPAATTTAAASAGTAPAEVGEAALREAISKVSRDVIERIAWEIVPQLAETIVREQIDRLVKERQR